MMKHTLPAVLASVLLAPLPVWAGGAAGTITYVKGTAERGATVAGPFQPLKRGGTIGEGEFLKTGPDARVELKFGDGSIMRLSANTTMQLGNAKPGRPQLPAEVTLSSGLLWARIAKAVGGGGDNRFAVRTHNAVAGVRGTVFQTTFGSDGSTLTVVYEGQVAVTNALGAFEKIIETGKGNAVLPDGTVLDATDMKDILAKADAIAAWEDAMKEMDNNKEEAAPADAPKEGAAPKEDGLKVREDITKMTPQEMVGKTDVALNEMRASLRSAVDLVAQARKQKDIVRLNCLNERVTQMKGVLKVAEDAAVALQESSGAGDVDGARTQYTKVVTAQERVSQLRVQAQNCVGAESYYGGDTEVVTDINPALAGGDPFFGDRPVGTTPVDDYSNGPKTPGDNTNPDTPPPPPPASAFQP